MIKKTHINRKLHKGEKAKYLHVFLSGREKGGMGRGEVKGEAQSNLLVALMNFIVSKIIVLLSVSGNPSLPYKYNLISF